MCMDNAARNEVVAKDVVHIAPQADTFHFVVGMM